MLRLEERMRRSGLKSRPVQGLSPCAGEVGGAGPHPGSRAVPRDQGAGYATTVRRA